jgi:hypothetical protein
MKHLEIIRGALLTSDKESIAYYHYKNKRNKIVIIAHGFYNSKDSLILQRLAKSLSDEYDVFMFDFRGHGQSSGLFTWTSKEERDLEAVLGYLNSKYKKKGLIAFSLGASIGINVLSEKDGVDSFICVSAPSDFEKIDYQLWKLDWENDVIYTLLSKDGRKGKGVRPGPFWLAKKKPIQNIGKIKIPILYIHGDKDWVVRPWHSEYLYKNTNSKKKIVIIEGGPHAEYLIRKFPKLMIELVKDWLKETLSENEG